MTRRAAWRSPATLSGRSLMPHALDRTLTALPKGHWASHRVAIERQEADQPDHGPLREGEHMHDASEVVFEQALALRCEERDRLLVIGRIGAGETEIDLLALGIERHPLEAE